MAISKALKELFLQELASRGLPAPITQADGTFLLEVNDFEITVSLDNLAKEFASDQDSGRIVRFMDALLATFQDLPPWPEAKAGIRFCAEPTDYQFGDTLRQPISDSLCRVLGYVDSEETRIIWLTPDLLHDWNKSQDEVAQVAADNMAALLNKTPIEIEPIEQYRLGIFATDSPSKASLIFSPNLKEVLSAKLGWPVYAVIPCRDFAYVFPDEDRDLIGRLGPVVVQEFSRSAYPISTEVFRISDDGIRAIGAFPKST
jgi:hypothetical protein